MDRKFLTLDPSYKEYNWTSFYKELARVNLVLEYLNKVGEGNNENPNLKIQLEAEAKAIRAYTHFNLVLNYCQHPSSTNPNKRGLPYRDNISLKANLSRGTVKETMNRIKGDINDAQKLFESIGLERLDDRRHRLSKINLMAIKARVALYEGDYKTAYEASNYVLSKYPHLEDLNNDKNSDDPYHVDSLRSSYTYGTDNKDTVYYKFMPVNVFGDYGESIVKNKEILYRHISYSVFAVPSKKLYELYPPQDLRKIKFYDNMSLYNVYGNNSIGDNYPKDTVNLYDGSIYSRITRFFSSSYIIRGPTVPEMMLIKAECIARGINGDKTAVKILEELREKRFRPGEAPAIKGDIVSVLEERRRELPFMVRFYDLKRLNALEGADIWVRKAHYSDILDPTTTVVPDKIVIEPNSNHYALPIPIDDLNAGGWEQNPE